MQPRGDRALPLRGGDAGELARVDEHLVVGVRDVGAVVLRGRAVGRRDDLADLDPVALGERVVALVVRGHRHDRAGAVLHQDVVGDPDRDRLAVDRVDGVAAGEDAVLLLRLALDRRARGRVAHVVGDGGLVLRARRQLRDQRVLRCQREERRAEERVRPRREDGQLLAAPVDAERDARALRAADPVPLHRQHALGPGLERVHLVQQLVGVLRDLEEPLRQAPGLDLRPAALAVAVDHLLVREHGLVLRAPLDGRLVAVGQPALEEPQEDPLRPAVVLGLRGRDLARPVDRPPHALHLAADRLDVAVRDLARVAALLDRRVLGVQAERVVPHRAQDRGALAPPDVREDVAERVVEDVPHVELAGGVREHLEDVRRGRVRRGRQVRVRDLERALVGPHGLPLGLDGPGVVALGVLVLHRRSLL